MLLVPPSFEILTNLVREDVLRSIEQAGRTCYKSEDRMTTDSSSRFVENIVGNLKHESVIEHTSLSVKFVVDRGVSHELVRHRLCAFSQESTRYCNYAKKGVTFVVPPWVSYSSEVYTWADLSMLIDTPKTSDEVWLLAMLRAEEQYLHLLSQGWSPQQARSVLPNSLKTEIVCTANLREWRHILRLRTAKSAHPQMQEVMRPLLENLQGVLPEVFSDIGAG